MLSALHKSTLTRIAQAHQIRDARRSKMATEEKYMGKLDGKIALVTKTRFIQRINGLELMKLVRP